MEGTEQSLVHSEVITSRARTARGGTGAVPAGTLLAVIGRDRVGGTVLDAGAGEVQVDLFDGGAAPGRAAMPCSAGSLLDGALGSVYRHDVDDDADGVVAAPTYMTFTALVTEGGTGGRWTSGIWAPVG